MTDARKRDLAKIHIARKQLVISDDAYRAMLMRIGGVSSSADLDARGRSKVLYHLQALGWKPKTKGKPHNFSHQSMPAMISKIEALLADMGRPWAYADSIAKQMFGIEKCAWVREPKQLKALIAALYNIRLEYSSELLR